MKHRAMVFGYGCESWVVPPRLMVSNGDTVVITGVDSKIKVWIPWIPPTRRVSPTGGSKSVTLHIRGFKPGVYPYSVYHEKTRSIAEGKSSPIIIIQR